MFNLYKNIRSYNIGTPAVNGRSCKMSLNTGTDTGGRKAEGVSKPLCVSL